MRRTKAGEQGRTRQRRASGPGHEAWVALGHSRPLTVRFWGSQSYTQVFNCMRGQCPKPPHCSRVNCILKVKTVVLEGKLGLAGEGLGHQGRLLSWMNNGALTDLEEAVKSSCPRVVSSLVVGDNNSSLPDAVLYLVQSPAHSKRSLPVARPVLVTHLESLGTLMAQSKLEPRPCSPGHVTAGRSGPWHVTLQKCNRPAKQASATEADFFFLNCACAWGCLSNLAEV